MSKIVLNHQRQLTLPQDFLERRHIQNDTEYWLGERNGDLLLHPCRADVRKLYIEPTTRCNLMCTTCIRNIWSDPIEDMSLDTFQHILEGIPELPQLERVVFTSFGEPFTQPHLLEMVEALRRFNLKVTIGTNGLLIDSRVARELVRLGVDRVIVSIDGGKPETYARVRGALLDGVVGKIHLLNETKKQMHSLLPAIGIEFVALKSNVQELELLAKMAAQLNVSRILVSNVLSYTEELRSEILYGYEPLPPIKNKSWALWADAWVMWAIQEMPRMHWGAERRCRFVNDHAMVIGWDGGISPCYALSHNYTYYAIDGVKKTVHRYVLGNVNQQSMLESWTTEEYVRFRSDVKAFHFPSCPDCDLRDSCDLRAENKGCWGWEPSCADCLWAQGIVRCP